VKEDAKNASVSDFDGMIFKEYFNKKKKHKVDDF
jgi:hypothetical protein